MIYCIVVERGGIGEEDVVLHKKFDTEPTREEIIEIIKHEDIGYDENFCRYNFYRID